ncbi:hypothetical protein VOLCADRAFT_106209 [Volvox carteri f. nagariensis]|uniref:Uncharacterized protein n=1 Tax=Volvox carteri f. nagariensis TaxID=3068 RepID=D8U5U4_VOLCA|nr:uncharacterized protein VOLCADRAFT_106209 [Volvox carteri f. nagariensis]EFJ44982.1 hypothetical protein VOLCADRAFT_106209 [Volvox carteri f. nagariensis]|eukprot:XP_002953953.1 hypothetical protein VOLCADRAFT_106209 [Volvox carteri f. nagariensis]
MDGTLTEAHIDFADMRARTGIPVGDLFTVMESWGQDSRILAAMTTILQIEEQAARAVSAKPGLLQLLQLIKDHKVPVALVTRNTSDSVAAFFRIIGPEWSGLFSQVLTREFKYVKPDRRLLVHVAQAWGINPADMLMVGDSFEDVECGGGNEKPGTVVQPPPGAVATFSVGGLGELAERLALAGEKGSQAAGVALGWPARLAAGEVIGAEGAPAPGLDYLDWLAALGVIRCAPCSFPRMGRAAGGLASCQDAEWGDQLLHVFCGAGALTKLLASQGLQASGVVHIVPRGWAHVVASSLRNPCLVWAVDADVEAARKRGLRATPFSGAALGPGCLDDVLTEAPEGGFDCVLLDGSHMSATQRASWWTHGSLRSLLPVLAPGARLCVQVPLLDSLNPAAVLSSMCSIGLEGEDLRAGQCLGQVLVCNVVFA